VFTGIVESVGTIAHAEHSRDGSRVVVQMPKADDIREGESIAVNGACLTASVAGLEEFTADVSAETLRRTTLGRARIGDAVHLERSLRVGDRLGGHFVQGHVDEIGIIRAITPEGVGILLDVAVSPDFRRFLVAKGSVALDGVSLTIASLTPDGARIALIPYTLDSTTFRSRRVGDALNVEYDMLAKYVARLLGQEEGAGPARLDESFLQRHGYA
jgi:riboflavin synthase